jgi:hypothetical protein
LETHAQISRYAKLTGAIPRHVDSHQHVHCIPEVAEALAGLFALEGVATTRIPVELQTSRPWIPIKTQQFYSEVSSNAQVVRRVYDAAGIGSSSHFIGMQLTGSDSSVELLRTALAGVGAQATPETIEWMVHPGYTTPNLSASASASPSLRTLEHCPEIMDLYAKEIGNSTQNQLQRHQCHYITGPYPDSFAQSRHRESELNLLLNEEAKVLIGDFGFDFSLVSFADSSITAGS